MLTMCKYIPDHGLRDDAEFHLTNSYFRACSEAYAAPISPTGIGDEEFLWYFVSGQDGEPIFSVKSVKQKGDSVIAKVYIQQGFDGIPWENSEKEVHTMRLVRDMDSVSERYLLDDFDNTKQECIDYVKKVREEYKSGEFERNIRNDGGSTRDINNFRRELRAFYARFGDDSSSSGSTGRKATNSQASSNPSRSTDQQTFSFTSPMDVTSYLRSRKFSNSAGNTMSFSSSLEMAIDGTVLTGAMRIVGFNSSQAVISGVSPYDGGTVRLRIDAINEDITNIDEPSEVFRLKTSGGMRF